jgi:hypothetical protein
VIGVVILVIAVVVWRLGQLPAIPDTQSGHDRRLLLITVTTAGISLAALVLSFLGPATGVLR